MADLEGAGEALRGLLSVRTSAHPIVAVTLLLLRGPRVTKANEKVSLATFAINVGRFCFGIYRGSTSTCQQVGYFGFCRFVVCIRLAYRPTGMRL
jgi:hypothetical protein